MPDRVFTSYSHKDQEDFDAFHRHLRIAVGGDEHLEIWADTEIEAGAHWDREIETTLEQIRVAVLLVSTDFLDSECIRERELPILLRRRLQEKLILTPPSSSGPVSLTNGSSRSRSTVRTVFGRYGSPNSRDSTLPGNPLSRLPESDRELVLLYAARTVRDLALHPHQPSDYDQQRFQLPIDTDTSPLEMADAVISNAISGGRPIVELGWSTEEALETRMRPRTFEEDLDAPGMEVYDELQARRCHSRSFPQFGLEDLQKTASLGRASG